MEFSPLSTCVKHLLAVIIVLMVAVDIKKVSVYIEFPPRSILNFFHIFLIVFIEFSPMSTSDGFETSL